MSIIIICTLLAVILITRLILIPKIAPYQVTQIDTVLFKKHDWLLCGIVTLLYAALSFYHLGNFKQDPVWYGDGAGKQINIIFDKPTVVSKIGLYGCGINDSSTQLSLVDQNDKIINIHEIRNNINSSSSSCELIYVVNNQNKMLGYKIKVIVPTIIINKVYVFDKDGNFINNYSYNYNNDSKLDNPEGIFHATKLFAMNNVVGNMVFDEKYYALAAYNYTIGKFDINTAHPQLSELLIAIGIKTFGMSPFGWRIIPNLFGIMLLPLIYLFALRLFKRRFIAFLAMLFIATDFMHFTLSRLAVIEPIVVFFNVLTYYYLWVYISQRDINLKKSLLALFYCSISFGLAASTKWSGVFAFPLILGTIMIKERGQKFLNLRQIIFCAIFLLLGILIYCAIYIPCIYQSGTKFITTFFELQRIMLQTHFKLATTYNTQIASKWWQWPLMQHTTLIFYWIKYQTEQSVSLCLMGNPILWWTSVPVIIYAVVKARMNKDFRITFLVLIYFLQYIPFILSHRVMYSYYYYNIVIYEMILFAEMLSVIYKLKSRFYKLLVMLYLTTLILFSIIYYPIYSGTEVSRSYVYKYLKLNNTWDM